MGIDAFDLQAYEIDITPWVSHLASETSGPRELEIRVVGLADNGLGDAILSPVGSYWVVSGNMFLWLDPKGPPDSVGLPPVVFDPEPDIVISSNTDASEHQMLNYEVAVSRQFRTWNSVGNPSDLGALFNWNQRLTYTNVGTISDEGTIQSNRMLISGSEWSEKHGRHDSMLLYERRFSYPLQVETRVVENTNSKGFSIDATLDFSKNVRILGNSVFSSHLDALESGARLDGYMLNTRQNGTAYYFSNGTNSGSGGATEQILRLKSLRANMSLPHDGTRSIIGADVYSRHVLAVNNTLVMDTEAELSDAFTAGVSRGSEFAPIIDERIVGAKILKTPLH